MQRWNGKDLILGGDEAMKFAMVVSFSRSASRSDPSVQIEWELPVLC